MIAFRRFLCLLLVAFFVMGKAAYAWHGQGVAHSIEHSQASIPETDPHGHSHGHDNEADHLLVHLSPAMESAVFGAEPYCSLAPGYSISLALPPALEPRHVALEPPLRPPKAGA